jgi:hypothetical protein
VHQDRFTLVSARGVIAETGAQTITVDGDEGGTFTLHPEARVFFTPSGRGPGRAQVISMAELQVGDRVLVLGARTDAGAIARQIVKRPAAPGG